MVKGKWLWMSRFVNEKFSDDEKFETEAGTITKKQLIRLLNNMPKIVRKDLMKPLIYFDFYNNREKIKWQLIQYANYVVEKYHIIDNKEVRA